MIRFLKFFALAWIVAHVGLLAAARPAMAQQAVVVTGYPVQPILTYFPERRGLFGQRVVYKPVVTYSAPTSPPVVAVPTAPARVTVRYAPRAYAVPAPIVVARPVAPVVVAPPPVVVAPAPVVMPAPVVTGYPPIIVP